MGKTLRSTSKSLVRIPQHPTQGLSPTLKLCTTEHQPFDEALDRTVIALREQALVSEQTIAERRRNVPNKVHDLLADLLERQRATEISLSTAEMAAAEAIETDSENAESCERFDFGVGVLKLTSEPDSRHGRCGAEPTARGGHEGGTDGR